MRDTPKKTTAKKTTAKKTTAKKTTAKKTAAKRGARPTTDKKTGRRKGVGQTSIAIPTKLLEDIGVIADRETRSRNMQIQRLLEASVEDYWNERGGRPSEEK